jgi:hypothetical protein
METIGKWLAFCHHAHPDDNLVAAVPWRSTLTQAIPAHLILAKVLRRARAREWPGATSPGLLSLRRASWGGHAEFRRSPDNRLDLPDLLDVVKIVETKLVEVRPTTLYTHWANDLNIDHRICCQP